MKNFAIFVLLTLMFKAMGALLKTILMVEGSRKNPMLLVLGTSSKSKLKVWDAFQNPLVLDCVCMLINKNLVVVTL